MNDAGRHRRAMEIFEAVCDLPPDQRAAQLDEACAQDSDLRSRVESLLRSDAATDPFVAAGEAGRIVADFVGVDAAATPPALPERVGPYRVVRRIGEGGMGIIFEAEQESPRRRVALKILRPGLVGHSVLRRFQNEAHVLGQLQHPGIAQIHEAGLARTPLGEQPYFAMELIDGRPLDRYAVDRKLDTAQRLELIARVCDAVQHAHQQGVIHRDLKPGNILVVADRPHADPSPAAPPGGPNDAIGQPKVLDFGVARMTDAEPPAITVLTEAGQLIGTLAYMSPEQLSDTCPALDGRSDVYALGVVLYELLSGRLPHDVRNRPVHDAIRVIQEEEPTRLASVDRAFRGDIDTILCKALEKDRQRRYRSPAAFAADIRRYLAHEPLQARPVSSLYQLRKFTRRNKALVAGVVATMAACLIGATASAYFAVRANRNAQLAGEREARALRASYRASIAAAAAALRENDVPAAERHLLAAPPSLRSWDWEHLTSRLDHSFAAAEIRLGPATPSRTRYLRGRTHVWFDAAGQRVHLATKRSGVSLTALFLQSWDAATLDPRDSRVLEEVALFAPSLDGERLFVRGIGGGASARDARTGATIHSTATPPHDDALRFLAKPLPAALFDYPWRLRAAELGPGNTPSHAIASPDGCRIACWLRRDLVVLDRAGQAPAIPIEAHSEGVSDAVFSPDGRYLATAGYDRRLALYDAADGRRVWATSNAHRDAILALAISPDGALLATGGEDRLLKLWDTASGRLLATRVGHRYPLLALAFDRDGSRIASASAAHVRLWSAATGDDPAVMPHDWFVTDLAISPDGALLASAGATVRLWDVRTGLPVARLPAPASPPETVSFSPDGRRLLVDAVIYDTRSGRRLATLDGHAEDGAFDPGGRFILGNTRRWDAASYNPLPGHPHLRTWSLEPTGRFLSATDQKEDLATVYDLDSLRIVSQWDCPATRANLLVGDTRTLAVGRRDNAIALLDRASGHHRATLRGHSDWVVCLAEIPRRRILVSGAGDRTLRLWNLDTRAEMAELRGHLDTVNALAVTPDGHTIFSASGDHTVRRWDTRPVRELRSARLEYRAIAARLRPRIDQLFAELGDADAAVEALQADESLSARQRQIAYHLVLSQAVSGATAP